MKETKRAHRRWKKHVKFIKRLKTWIKPGMTRYFGRDEFGYPIEKQREDIIQEALKGTCYRFLRTTGNPCNCDGCTYLKYERPLKSKINRQIWDDIQDDLAT